MGLDGAFGHVQIAGNFGVVTSLEQQIDDLLLPASQPVRLLVHLLHLAVTQSTTPMPGDNRGLALRIKGLLGPCSATTRPKPASSC